MTWTPTAYPLAWPDGFPRTPSGQRERWASRELSLPNALRDCQAELYRFGATRVVLSSDVTLGVDSPRDPGVVAYCTRNGLAIAIPCDRWNSVAGNLRAIAKSIEALRGLERWGAKQMLHRMFTGLVALPPPEAWRAALGLPPGATLADAEEAHKRLARAAHPDKPGGSHDAMARLNSAIEHARKELGHG